MKRTWKCLTAFVLACTMAVGMFATVGAAIGPGPDQQIAGEGATNPQPDPNPPTITPSEDNGESGGTALTPAPQEGVWQGDDRDSTLYVYPGGDNTLTNKDGTTTTERDDLQNAGVKVELFQVAGAHIDGYDVEYTLQGIYAGNTVLEDGIQTILDDPYLSITKEEGAELDNGQKLLWQMAEAATALTVTKGEDGKLSLNGTAAYSGDAFSDIGGIAPGLYLVFAHGDTPADDWLLTLRDENGAPYTATQVRTENWIYNYRPQLVFIPGKPGDEVANLGPWLYYVEMTLKPTVEDGRVGDLEIVKWVENYLPEEPGHFTFRVDVFDPVTGELIKEKSGIFTLDYDPTGSNTITVKDIPEDARVVVTEVYSGASYELVGEAEKTGTITAHEVTTVEYTNRGTHGWGGYVTNHFYRDDAGEWQWQPIPEDAKNPATTPANG